MHEDDRTDEPSAEILSNDGPLFAAPSVLPEVAFGADAEAAPKRRRRTAAVAGATVVVLGVGAGAWAVGSALSGGGAQPESVVPASAVFYVEVDLDPAAGQKVEAFRFLRKFPELKDTFTEDGGFGPGFAKLFDDSDADYATDIEPWLGKRFAIALVPGPGKKEPMRVELVVQATDEGAALESLTRLMSDESPEASVVVRDGYAIIAGEFSLGFLGAPGEPDNAPADVAKQLSMEAEAASLETNETYTNAVQPYGSGVMTVWSDNAGLDELTKSLPLGLGGLAGLGGLGGFGGLDGLDPASFASGTADGPDPTGTSVAVLRFDGGTLELVGATTGSESTPLGSGGVPAVSDLPDSTLAALGGSGLGEALSEAVGPYVESFGSLSMLSGEFESGTSGGTKPPPDSMFGPFGDPSGWPTLFGDQTVLAVGGEREVASVGVRIVGGQDTVDSVTKVVDSLGGDALAEPTADGVVVADDPDWLAALAAGGSFGGSQKFRDVVPDADQASVVGYVDIAGLVERFGADLDAGDRASLDALSALGFTATSSGDTSSFRLRLLTD